MKRWKKYEFIRMRILFQCSRDLKNMLKAHAAQIMVKASRKKSVSESGTVTFYEKKRIV